MTAPTDRQLRIAQQRKRFSQFTRIATAWVLACHFYYLITQTRYMSASLYNEYSYDAPYLTPRDGEGSSGTRTYAIPGQNSRLPKWLSDYFDWHVAMRKKYPGEQILTDPESPGVLIKICAFKCGGLHDRLGGLGWDLYFANQTRRVLMIHWCIPAPIEHFLVPNIVDWTVPRPRNSSLLDERLFSNTTEAHIHCDRAVGDWKGLFDGWREYMQGEDFWEEHIDLALDRAIHGNYSDHKILRMKVLGVDQRLEQRLRVRHNETDSISWTDSFPIAFWTLFKPAKGLQRELDENFRHLQISSQFDYSAPPFYAIHTRLRHPRGHVGVEVKGKGGAADKTGMLWDGEAKQFAINQAEQALHCAQKVHLDRHSFYNPNYFYFGDSEDLVSYMGEEHGASGVHIRNMTGVEVLHIDRQQGFPPQSYYSAFIDLFVAAQASCIVFGAGNYALLSAKINTRGARQCLIRHYPDSSHPMVLRIKFMECNEERDLIPTTLEREISDLKPFYSIWEF
eukprot:CAMPEP_0183734518 /NCGR_PEP_ID=MMETSP0737-20130205/44018_1 /TAXON_ID=385413 /ORGANISM="Thalassiosira miniscula, Strain CCMP1093" /LENGTH=507 /DNA_ID=CAMNT_0025968019 /DNA_START=22 /DNA_END=1545 /DNA_ORIENTATION=+